MKAGWKTTEFWGALIVSVAGVLTAIADSAGIGWLGLVAASVASFGYSLSRGLVKKSEAEDA